MATRDAGAAPWSRRLLGMRNGEPTMDNPKNVRGEIVDDDQFEAREAVSAKLGNLWWTFLLRGLLVGTECMGRALVGGA